MGACYACGADPDRRKAVRPIRRPFARLRDFEDGKIAPFTPASRKTLQAWCPNTRTQGRYALRLQNGYAVWDGAQDWTGYDFFKADVFNAGRRPRVPSTSKCSDQGTTDYWTRVNYQTVCRPARPR